MKTVDSKEMEIKKLAQEVLLVAKNWLMVSLRFMDPALSRLQAYATEEESATILTDGSYIFYRPLYILERYRMDKLNITRLYFHTALHCVFSHMYGACKMQKLYWDLACDIAIENIIDDLNVPILCNGMERVQKRHLEQIQQEVKALTAENIYHWLVDKKMDASQVAKLRGAFYGDDHTIWYMSREEAYDYLGLPKGWNGSGKENVQGDGNGGMGYLTAQQWQDIANKIENGLQSFLKLKGDAPGSLVFNLREATREKYDYTEFLRRFATMGETMKLNDEEFDYIYYTFGIDHYGNVPLIEPLEYKEVPQVREFVIALDTSGSTMNVIQNFLQKTYNILKSTESFSTKVNVHIVQCDAAIQEHEKITSQEEFDEYLKHFKVKGCGGTSFAPVFDLVNKLLAEGEFQHLKGLIYFTDGYADFPEVMPPYETTFVFIESFFNNYDVPPWASKLVLPASEFKSQSDSID